MNQVIKEYISSLIPKDLKKGDVLLAEGHEIAKKVTPSEPKYFKKFGTMDKTAVYKSMSSGGYCVNIGMATVDDTVDACLELKRWGDEVGIPFTTGLLLPSINAGVPMEKRDENMDTTAFQLNGLKDYVKFNREEVNMPMGNHSIASPNAIQNVIDGLEAGVHTWGSTSQLSWDYPGCEDKKAEVEDLVRAIGILQAHKDYYPEVGCYVEDGLAACLVDTVGIVAYYMFEQYIYNDLCGLRINPCFGALVSDLKTKAALMVVLNDIANEKGGMLSFVHGSTTLQWDHDISANYGASAQEMLMIFLTLDHYDIKGAAVLAVPATEAVTVPTLQEIKDIIAATGRTKEFVDQWRDMMDWSEVDRRIEILKTQGSKMFHNMLNSFEKCGVDIKDPAQLLMIIKNIDASLIETYFHPSLDDSDIYIPWFPNDMGELTVACVNEAIAELKEQGYADDALKDMSIIVASTDVHVYGAKFAVGVLNAFGANVIDMGVDNSPQHIIDFAKELGINLICASTHSGNALAVGNYFEQIINDQKIDAHVSMGGIITSILPGHSEPSQVADMINEHEHILASNSMVDTFKYFKSL